MTGLLVASERLQSMLPCFIVHCLHSQKLGGPLTVRKDCLRCRGWSQGKPIIQLWTVLGGTIWGGGTYSMTFSYFDNTVSYVAETLYCCMEAGVK